MTTYIAPAAGTGKGVSHEGGPRLKSNLDLWIRAAIRIPLAGLFAGALLYVGAGTTDWERGWIFLFILIGTLTGNILTLLIRNPDLLRARWAKRKYTKRFDKIFGLFYGVTSVAFFMGAGWDVVRHGWTSMPVALAWVGGVLHVLGLIPITWCFLANPYLETTVRIQTDRGHQVVTDGPYRYVRHPLYVGVILWYLAWAMILGSWVAMGIAGVISAGFIVRTALEDKTLQEELEGYSEFCEQTRNRLIPGVW